MVVKSPHHVVAAVSVDLCDRNLLEGLVADGLRRHQRECLVAILRRLQAPPEVGVVDVGTQPVDDVDPHGASRPDDGALGPPPEKRGRVEQAVALAVEGRALPCIQEAEPVVAGALLPLRVGAAVLVAKDSAVLCGVDSVAQQLAAREDAAGHVVVVDGRLRAPGAVRSRGWRWRRRERGHAHARVDIELVPDDDVGPLVVGHQPDREALVYGHALADGVHVAAEAAGAPIVDVAL